MEYHPEEELSMYPDEITLGNRVLSCSYNFDPGKQDDGVTIQVPSGVVSTIPLESADWQIPALLREKITALIKGLPKEYRKNSYLFHRQWIPLYTISKAVTVHSLHRWHSSYMKDSVSIYLPRHGR